MKNLSCKIVLVSFFICFALPAFGSGSLDVLLKEFDPEMLEKIMSKGILLAMDSAAPTRDKPVTTGALIKAPLDKVWNMMCDFERYPEWIPTVASAKIEGRTPDTATVFYELFVLELGPIKMKTDYTLKYTFYKSDNKVIISWVSGKVKDVNGSFDFIPIKNGKETLFFYTVRGNYRQATVGAAFLFGRQPELEATMALGAGIVLVEGAKKELEKETAQKPTKKVSSFGLQDLDVGLLQKILSCGPFYLIDKSVPAINKPVTQSCLINAPVQQVWNATTDFAHHAEWIPALENVKILEQTPTSSIVYSEDVLLRLGPVKMSTEVTLKYIFHPPGKIDISWIAGKVKDAKGTWEFVPIEDGKKTLVFYTFSADWSKSMLGADFLFGRQPELKPMFSLLHETVMTEAARKHSEPSGKK